MFSGFNAKLTESNFKDFSKSFEDYKKIGEEHINKKKAEVNKAIEEYANNNTNVVNGTKLQKDWFPLIEADIFISHSHADERLAIAFAGYLFDTFNLTCFIDSCVWGYADELLEKLNQIYSNKRTDKDGGVLYTHDKCNTVSKHVNTMLSIALQKMIDKTEAVMLLNTENSIINSGNIKHTETYSPWLYAEITCTDIVRKKPLIAYRDYKTIYKFASLNESGFLDLILISYDVSLNHLVDMDIKLLKKWEEKFRNVNEDDRYEYSLDALYEETHKRGLDAARSSHENGSACIIKKHFEQRSNRKIKKSDVNYRDRVIGEHCGIDDKTSFDEIINDGFSRITNGANRFKRCKDYCYEKCWCYYSGECQCFQEIATDSSHE